MNSKRTQQGNGEVLGVRVLGLKCLDASAGIQEFLVLNWKGSGMDSRLRGNDTLFARSAFGAGSVSFP
jgi:hypothetical protein